MGAGASMGNDQVLDGSHDGGGAQRYFCHQCHQITRSRSQAAECGACGSAFVESMEGGLSGGGSGMGGMGTLAGRSGGEGEGSRRDMNLSQDQSRRLANAAIMLRLLERQLQSDLETIQSTYRQAQAEEESAQYMSPVMKRKLRRPKTDVDMICSQPSCPICSEDFVVDSEVICLPCNHIYHEDCVVPWLDMKKTCPICRYELTNDLPSVTLLEHHTREELINILEEEKKEFYEEERSRKVKAASDDMSDSSPEPAATKAESSSSSSSSWKGGTEIVNKTKIANEIIEVMQRRRAAAEKEKGVLDSNRLREIRERQNRPREGFRTAQERAANPSPSNRTLREVLEEGERENARQSEERRERMRQLGILPAAESTGGGSSGSLSGTTSGTLPSTRNPSTVASDIASRDDFGRVLAAILQSTNMGLAAGESDSDEDDPLNASRTRNNESGNVAPSTNVTEARTNLQNARSALANAREENARLEGMRVMPIGSSLTSTSANSAPNTFVIRSNGDNSMQIERRQALREAIDIDSID